MRRGMMMALALMTPAMAAAQEPPPGEGPRGTSQDFGAQRYDAVGYASWYGDEFAGRPMASGQPFNPDAVIAAHPTLPLGSFAEVTALDTGRTILVLIADRGPNMPGRLIDLSRGAARLLGNDRAGLVPVRVRTVDLPGADQAALRAGQPGSARLDASPAMLVALRKKLGAPPVAVRAPVPTPNPGRLRPIPGQNEPQVQRPAPAGSAVRAGGRLFRPPPCGKRRRSAGRQHCRCQRPLPGAAGAVCRPRKRRACPRRSRPPGLWRCPFEFRSKDQRDETVACRVPPCLLSLPCPVRRRPLPIIRRRRLPIWSICRRAACFMRAMPTGGCRPPPWRR